MRFNRSCGTLVHPTSFPSEYGIGDLGPAANRFIDFLEDTNQTIWQVLPLGPVGYGNSPYASYSAFAGNPYLISPSILADKGLISRKEADNSKIEVTTKADFDAAYRVRDSLLEKASSRFYDKPDKNELNALKKFEEANKNWLQDYCLFMVFSSLNNRKPWNQWKKEWAQRDASTLEEDREKYAEEIRTQVWLQYEFFNQWKSLKKYANNKGIQIIGDIPIFVDHNSADVWANPKYFAVDKQGNRELVAGVPPDYFSETGQLWGNPLYKWEALEKDGYEWWIERFKQMFNLYDAIRVDHFRGFEAYWEVAASEDTAIKGRWVKGPGANLFKAIRKSLGDLPIIAEDLGFVTPEVEKLRDQFNFPGMKILQFAFDSDSKNDFLPHNYTQNCVVYSGTHDNDTSIGWYQTAPEVEQHRFRKYTRSKGNEPNWELIRLGMLSVADQAIFPLQDYMNLDGSHRMNIPGTVGDNWNWRYTHHMLEHVDRQRIRDFIELGNRLPRDEA